MSVFAAASLDIRSVYHEINQTLFPEPLHAIGRALNAPEDEDESCSIQVHETDEGYRIFYVNEIVESPQGQKYRVIDLLGSGTFSYAVKCEDITNPGCFVAIKVIKNIPVYRAAGLQEVKVHGMMTKAPTHKGKKFVMEPITDFEMDGHVCIVEPLMARSLFEGLPQTTQALESLDQIRSLMRQLLETLTFVHATGIIHCDIKPDNVLMANEDSDEIRLIDFGSAMTVLGSHQQYIQSRFYRSIEVMLGLPVGVQIDLWSVGCMAAEMFLDFAIFACESENDSVPCIVGMLGDIPDSIVGIASSWRKFYDMTPFGFHLKTDPTDALLNKHLYGQIFRDTGMLRLHDLVVSRYTLDTETEIAAVNAFDHFVRALLTYDPMRRLTAEAALSHPFITGEAFTETWQAPPPRKKQPPTIPAVRKPMSTGFTPVDGSQPNDFLALM
jgi:dual specificity protein kinase YAK1